ncbi:MAG: ribosome silencing factor [Verrucomicrobiota bacterium]
MKSKKIAALELVKACCRALDDKKAGDLSVLDVSEQSSITDYLVIATGTSEPHLRALRIEVEKVFDDAKAHLVGKETMQESGWMIIDAFDVMVHIFVAEARERYGLERLWRDATEVSVGKLLGQVMPEVRRPKAKKEAPKKAAKPAKAKKKAPAKPRKVAKKR